MNCHFLPQSACIHAAVHLGTSLNDSLRYKSDPSICNRSWTDISTPSLLCIRPQPTWCFTAPNKHSVACHPHYKWQVLLKYKTRSYITSDRPGSLTCWTPLVQLVELLGPSVSWDATRNVALYVLQTGTGYRSVPQALDINTLHHGTWRHTAVQPLYSAVPTKGKAVPLQAWSGPEGSRKLRFTDFMTTAQDGGKVVSLTHRPPLPPGNTPGTHFC